MPQKTIKPDFIKAVRELMVNDEKYTQLAPDDSVNEFLRLFPKEKLPSLTLDQYCMGTATNDSFSWWLEQGLKKLGAYGVGSATHHLLYRKKDGTTYKPPKLKSWSDKKALQYVLKLQATVANADISNDLSWLDDSQALAERAGVKPLITLTPGRRLRLLTVYNHEKLIPISSTAHIGHFLRELGCSEAHIPKPDQAIARLMLLMDYYEIVRDKLENLTPFGFMRALYNPQTGISSPKKNNQQIIDEPTFDPEQAMNQYPNQILYGPPGTGKTYLTTDLAVRLAEPDWYSALVDDSEDYRSQIKAKYDELVSAGRIGFTTFHQSFSYEDFVEGIRATTEDDGSISYTVEKGVFLKACNEARATNQQKNLETLIEDLKNELLDQPITLTTRNGKSFNVIYKGKSTFRVQPHGSTKDFLESGDGWPVSIENIQKIYLDPTAKVYNRSYTAAILDYFKSEKKLKPYNASDANKQNYVFIIDEINRGNVASIFGELITLIEPSKRSGAEEALSLTLPYSRQSFSVPSNLYIIGTMNTADRSLALLDTALRRRFQFVEMMPKPELLEGVNVEGINIQLLLTRLNQRITALYDREHTLGHAFFMPLKTENPTVADLKAIFQRQIIPLLQEYFFEDWYKIRLVLGSDFIKEEKFAEQLFSEEAEFELPTQYRINEDALTDPACYRRIYETVSS